MVGRRAKPSICACVGVFLGMSLWLGGLGSDPSSASPATSLDACELLSPAAATRLLGAPVIQARFDHHRACGYRSTKNRDVVTAILTPLGGAKLALTQHLLRQEHRSRLDGQWVYWYDTPARYTKPEVAGTLSALKNGTLIMIVDVRTANPESTAREAMAIVLPGV